MKMDNDTVDLSCVACGFAIKCNQRGGYTVCGHGYIHYNCSYLGIKCDICALALTYDVNQSDNEFLSFELNQRFDDDQSSENSDIYNMLLEIKKMLHEQKVEQIRQANMIEELKHEIREFKTKEIKIQELQNDVLQLKYDKIMKDQKDLEEKMNKLSSKD